MWTLLRRWTHPALVLGVALLALAACSAAELEPAAPLRADGDTGLVVLSVTRSGMRNFDLFMWLEGPGQWVPRPIVLYAGSRARDWRGGSNWQATPADDPEGRLVVLKLAPGAYRVDAWSGQSTDGGMDGDGFDIYSGDLGLSFTVQSGTLTYLGSLHIQLPQELNYQANLMVATYRLALEDQRERDLGVARARFSESSQLEGLARLPVQFAQAGQDIRYYIINRKANGMEWE